MNEWLKQVYWNNTVQSYLYVAAGLLFLWFILKFIKGSVLGIIKRFTEKTSTQFDDILISVLEKFFVPYTYLAINYYIINQLHLNSKTVKVLEASFMAITMYYIVRLVNHAIHFSVKKYMEMKGEPEQRILQLNGILLVVKVIVWALGFLMLIDNLGYDVTTIVTGLGVGGIAIALAAQNIIGDLFSYLVIFFDKPFEVGDFIVIGSTDRGTVEKIGIKTSHLRSISGEQLIMPNSELVKATIRNFKRLQKRRMLFSIGVTYDTPAEKLALIPQLLEQIITIEKESDFDRANLSGFGDFSINFEIAYYVLSDDYKVYMQVHERVCLEIVKAFKAHQIEFAFPSQTIYMAK